MARVELENRLTIPLYRALFTGSSYTVEPPVMIPPNATVFWQTDDTGSVTYSASIGGGNPVGEPIPTYPPVPSFPGSTYVPVPSYPGVTFPPASGAPSVPAKTPVAAAPPVPAPPIEAAATAVAADAPTEVGDSTVYTIPPPAPVAVAPASAPADATATNTIPAYDGVIPGTPASSLPYSTYPPTTGAATAPADAPRPFTLAWQFTPTGRPRFSTQHVASGLRVDVRERFDGATYTVSRQRRKRVPAGPRRRALVIGSSLLASLLLLATITAAYSMGGLRLVSDLIHSRAPHNPFSAPSVAVPAPSLTLTASQTSVPLGATVTLTATSSLPIALGYEIDIIDTGSNQAVNHSPCVVGATCTATVVSPSPNTATYQASLEKGVQSGVLVTSATVTVLWLPPLAPTTISLSSSPAADSTGAVHVTVGETVTLTAKTDLPVDKASYQIAFYDTGGDRIGRPCTKGKQCATSVKRDSPGSTTYIAHAEPVKQGGARLSSSTIQVVWSPPPVPGSVSLSVSDANPMIGQSVMLTATASGPLDATGDEIAIFDTNGNRVSGSCTSGSRCTAQVSSATSAANVYLAHIEQGNLSGIAATSNTVAVTWSIPTITLTASATNPAWGQSVTLTATASRSVDTTGYVIQLVDLTDGVIELKYCASGSSCAVTISGPGNAVAIDYNAYIDKHNPSDPATSIARATPVTIFWPAPPAPVANMQASNTNFSEACQPSPDGPFAPNYTVLLDNTGSNVSVGWQFSTSQTDPFGNVWASASPSSGTVAAGQSQSVTINVDSGVCSGGTYNGTLILNFPQGGSQPNIGLTDTIG